MSHARFPVLTTPRRRWFALAAGVVIAGLVCWLARPLFNPANPLLDTPVVALEGLQAKPLFFNAAAGSSLRAQRPDLVPREGTDNFAQAVLEPRLFRQLDRQFRFEALLFTGDPSQSRPLLEHLAETKDWALSYVDHTSLVFRRAGGPAWRIADLEPVRARFAGASARVRATMLSQTAVKLVAVRELESARQLLDEAQRLHVRLPEVWSGWASYHMQRGEYAEAFANAERALKLDDENLPALAVKTHLLFATKQFSAAYELSRRLIERVPDDPNLLFYHAKIAHEAHAYKAEVEALEKIIAQAEAVGRPVSGYQMYLGQAHMTLGDGTRAIDAFMRVLNDPELPQDQRDFARESIARIKKRTGL